MVHKLLVLLLYSNDLSQALHNLNALKPITRLRRQHVMKQTEGVDEFECELRHQPKQLTTMECQRSLYKDKDFTHADKT